MWKSKFYGAVALNLRVDLDAIDATPARRRGGAGSSPLDRISTAASSPRNDLVKNCRVHPTHWLISTQALIMLLLEHMARHGLTVGVLDPLLFPQGQIFHRKKAIMQSLAVWESFLAGSVCVTL